MGEMFGQKPLFQKRPEHPLAVLFGYGVNAPTNCQKSDRVEITSGLQLPQASALAMAPKTAGPVTVVAGITSAGSAAVV